MGSHSRSFSIKGQIILIQSLPAVGEGGNSRAGVEGEDGGAEGTKEGMLCPANDEDHLANSSNSMMR